MIYDLIAIGIGPFNLGLAALTHNIPGFTSLFLEQNEEFNWHPGLMLPEARLQVPFYADLVTLADPTNPFSYMAFLKQKERLFRFAITENNFITRSEYNEYAQWVATSLTNCRFGHSCTEITYDAHSKIYTITAEQDDTTLTLFTTHVVIGVGTVPSLPSCCSSMGLFGADNIFHSSNYLDHKNDILSKKSVAVIGSGQSAAEIFYDLLQNANNFTSGLHWYTRSSRFFPMEYSKLTLEMTSPDYIDHFFHLPLHKKEMLLRNQDMLYKGINFSLINLIYDSLYQQSLSNTNTVKTLSANTLLMAIEHQEGDQLKLKLLHTELDKTYYVTVDKLILATGYKAVIPAFLDKIRQFINWLPGNRYDVALNYSINSSQTVFVQNAELHSHGFNTADLGMGPYRNAIIINSILGRRHYNIESNIAFQSFGIPADPAVNS